MSTPRGNRGRGGGSRGSPNFRGSPRGGRGQLPFTPGRGRGRGRGGKPAIYNNMDIIDVDIQQYSDVSTGRHSPAAFSGDAVGARGRGGRGRGGWRGRGRGQDNNLFPVFAPTATPTSPFRGRGGGSGSGRSTPRGRGRGAARNFRQDMPLSRMLDSDRPYLRPVMFVRGQEVPVLFQDEEEILEAVQSKEPESHAPTADRVARLFNLAPQDDSFFKAPLNDDMFAVEETEELMTIDFKSIGTIMTQEQSAKTPNLTSTTSQRKDNKGDHEESLVETPSIPKQTIGEVERTIIQTDFSTPIITDADAASNTPMFILDPNPTAPENVHHHGPDGDVSITITAPINQAPLGSASVDNILTQDEPDEVIVYEAPLPRTGRSTPNPSGVSSMADNDTESSAPAPNQIIQGPSTPLDSISFSSFTTSTTTKVGTPRSARRRRRVTKKDRRGALLGRRRFGDFGAMMEEMHLHEGEEKQRRYGSDIDWGDDSKDEAEEDGAMELDADVDQEAMSAFVKGMSAGGAQHITMDDVADIEKLRLEDEDEGSTSSGSDDVDDDDSEEEAVSQIIREAEVELVGVEMSDSDGGGEDSDDSEDSEDDGSSPKRNFQARLARARQNAKGKGKAVDTEMFVEKSTSEEEDEDEDDDYPYGRRTTWAEADERFFDDIQDVLDENDGILNGRDRRYRNALFKSIQDGSFDFNLEPITSKSKHVKYKNLPPELREQWKNDRAKKAENKKKRAIARLALAADPRAYHKQGKKARKTMLRSAANAALDSDNELPNQIVDYPTLVAQIRLHVADIGGPSSMALPPMAKDDRAKVHEIANAFGLKSVSKGNGKERYTTLVRTSRTGLKIDERKIAKITRSAGEFGFTRPGNRGERTPKGHRHKEGDEVGKAAPKIHESNIGYKMLATMGWTEGEVIGLYGGLEAPLKAIIKNTKLGLGASRS